MRNLVRTTEVMPPTMAVSTLAMAVITLLIPRPIAEKTCGKRGISRDSSRRRCDATHVTHCGRVGCVEKGSGVKN